MVLDKFNDIEAINLSKGYVKKVSCMIPREDLIDCQYDYVEASELTDILFILSTPRSGSTLLSDLIYNCGLCIPHEYFQPYEYLPILADRWGCITSQRTLNKPKFIDHLITLRTSTKGWLGINLHGEHIVYFQQFEHLFPKVRKHFVYIIRLDIIAQAVSYELASQTGQWNSNFDRQNEPVYNFHSILGKLKKVNYQNTLIQSYLYSKKYDCEKIVYEQLTVDPFLQVQKIIPDNILRCFELSSNLMRQSSSINEEWIRRFSYDFTSREGRIRNGKGKAGRLSRLIQRM